MQLKARRAPVHAIIFSAALPADDYLMIDLVSCAADAVQTVNLQLLCSKVQ
jgi:hypothetical protein